jgi:hypothetical protein
MTRHVLFSTFGLGFGSSPFPPAALTLTKDGVVSTPKRWRSWFDHPWTCQYSEIERAEAIRLSAAMDFLTHPESSVGVRIDRGPWTTRLIFLPDSTPTILAGLGKMGVSVESRPRRLGLHNLFGRG